MEKENPKTSNSKRALTTAPDSLPLPHLPEEIILDILLRLPVKSLLRFRCVSKSWLNLIATPDFIHAHLAISTNNNPDSHNRLIFASTHSPTLFHCFSLYPNKDQQFSLADTLLFDYDSKNIDALRIVGSCNGLICVAVSDSYGVVIWNPAIRKSRILPVSDSNGYCMHYGFGYDSVNDDYKVVEFSFVTSDQEDDDDDDEPKVRFCVYSMRGGCWRDMDWPAGSVIFDGCGVFANGVIHWKVFQDVPTNWGVRGLDVATEVLSEVELPVKCGDSRNMNVVLGVVLGGCLCALYDYGSYMDVWVMKEYGVKESWTKLFRSAYYFTCVRHRSFVRPKVLFVSEKGGILLSLDSDLIVHKPPNCLDVHRLGGDGEVEGVTYSESLIFPDFNSGAEIDREPKSTRLRHPLPQDL